MSRPAENFVPQRRKVRSNLAQGALKMLYVVTHDSRSDAEQLSAESYIESVATSSCRMREGIWFIESTETGVEIRRGLSLRLEPRTSIVVAMLAGFAAWQVDDEGAETWLAGHL